MKGEREGLRAAPEGGQSLAEGQDTEQLGQGPSAGQGHA